MSDLLLNLDELHSRHDKTEENRLKIFRGILKSCHNKIRKFNLEFNKQDCLFEPPVFIIGKPPYNYLELINYMITSLRKNGVRAEWLSSKKAIYISWRKSDTDLNKYHSHFTNMANVSNIMYAGNDDNSSQQFSILSVQPHDTSASKKKKKQNEKKPIQHIAMLEYSPGVKDFIPINLGGN